MAAMADGSRSKQDPDAGGGPVSSAGVGALFHVSRALGMAPYRRTAASGPWSPPWATRSRGWEAYSLLLGAAILAIVGVSSWNVYAVLTGSFYSDLPRISYMIKGMCGCCVHAVNLARRAHVLRALNNILQYEALDGGRAAGRAGRRVASESVVVGAQMLAVASVFTWTAVLSWPYYNELPVFPLVVSLLSTYLPALFLFATDMQFANLALLVHRQLRDLGRAAQRLAAVPAAAPRLATAVRLLRARQECLHGAVLALGGAYSPQLLLSVTLGLEEVTCGAYFVITSPFSAWRALIAGWAVASVGRMALVMTPCQWVEAEGEVIADAVNSALQMRHLSRGDREELEEFQMQLAHLKMRFSAGGVFPLDYAQLQKVISTITTYLVILLQMQGRPPQEHPPPAREGK